MKKIIALGISIIIFVVGFHYAYEKSKLINESRCLGCIALLPKAAEFTTFWIEYPPSFNRKGIPDFPSWLINESKNRVVMLFFWYKGCDPCREQWEDMVNAGIVYGEEGNGRMGERFSNVTLISIDILNDERGNVLNVFTPKGETPSTPTTVIIFTKNETYWYSFSGKADGRAGRPDIKKLEEIIEEAIKECYAGAHV